MGGLLYSYIFRIDIYHICQIITKTFDLSLITSWSFANQREKIKHHNLNPFFFSPSNTVFADFFPLVTTKTKFQWKTPTPPPPICQYTATKFQKTTQQHQSIKKHQLPTINKLIWPNLIWNIKKKKTHPWTKREKTQQTKSKNSVFPSATAELASPQRKQYQLRQRRGRWELQNQVRGMCWVYWRGREERWDNNKWSEIFLGLQSAMILSFWLFAKEKLNKE